MISHRVFASRLTVKRDQIQLAPVFGLLPLTYSQGREPALQGSPLVYVVISGVNPLEKSCRPSWSYAPQTSRFPASSSRDDILSQARLSDYPCDACTSGERYIAYTNSVTCPVFRFPGGPLPRESCRPAYVSVYIDSVKHTFFCFRIRTQQGLASARNMNMSYPTRKQRDTDLAAS